MASKRALVRELARTAWDAAVEDGSTEATARSLGRAADALRASPRMRQVMLHPGLTASRKAALLGLVVKLDGQSSALLESLIERRAIGETGRVRRAFDALLAARAEQALVRVWAAAPLSRAETAALTSVLERSLGRSVRLRVVASRALLGGLRVQVGERIIDGTIKGAFDRLERHLMTPPRLTRRAGARRARAMA